MDDDLQVFHGADLLYRATEPLSGREDDLLERVTENLREQFAKSSKVKKEEEVVNV